MYAMHYALTLPADYDMRIIRQRIASKGPLLDDLPGLGLKAYLFRERGANGSTVNQYATFYLWASIEGMGAFLWGGGGFSSIVNSFGRPPVRHWTGVSCFAGKETLADARFATIREESLMPDIDPGTVIPAALHELQARHAHPGICLSALAVDPQSWKMVAFTLWAVKPPADAGTRYEVGHLSRPQIDSILTT
jgi:hypothetical protein